MGKSMKIEYSITLDIKHQHAQKRTIYYLDCHNNKISFFINFPSLVFIRIQFENSIWFYPFRYQPSGSRWTSANDLFSLIDILPNISCAGMCIENAFKNDIDSLINHFWESPFVRITTAFYKIESLNKLKRMQENPCWFMSEKTPEYDLFHRFKFIVPKIELYIKESSFPRD